MRLGRKERAMSDVDYLATAKNHIAQIDGNHPAEYVKAYSLAAIANALIAIAEKVVGK